MSRLKYYIQLLRPHHWVKNLLVFAPIVFAQKVFDGEALTQTVTGFLVFCLAASTVYIVNDIVDRESDRRHPKKQSRPIASGAIRPGQASGLAVLLGCFSLGLGVWIGQSFVLAVIVYFAANGLYSVWLKHQPVLDLVIVSSFYLIRIFAGGIAAAVPISELLILVTFFLALFAVTIKRRQEFIQGTSSRRAESRN